MNNSKTSSSNKPHHLNNNNNNNKKHNFPWQGFDLSSRAFPDAPRQPVVLCVDPITRDDVLEQPHRALKGFMDEILLRLVEMARVTEEDNTNDSTNRIENKQTLMRCCLDLISVVNDSSDFDELGFDTLLQVACLFRGQKSHDALSSSSSSSWYRRLKILYLSQMKLEPKDLTGDGFCWKCLHSTCICSSDDKDGKKKSIGDKDSCSDSEVTETNPAANNNVSSPLTRFGKSNTKKKQQMSI